MSYRDPKPEELTDPLFERIWQTIKTWDINVPSEYGGYMGATGNHVCAIKDAVLAAALAAEGQGEPQSELTDERAQDLARSYLYGAMGYLGISELKDEAVKSVASRLRADFAAAAPSLHKEAALPITARCTWINDITYMARVPGTSRTEAPCLNEGYAAIYDSGFPREVLCRHHYDGKVYRKEDVSGYRLLSELAALYKEGAGGDTGLWRCPYCNIDLRASDGIGDSYGNISHPACLAKVRAASPAGGAEEKEH